MLLECFFKAELIAKFKSHYQADDLKRVLFIFPVDSWRKMESTISKELGVIAEIIHQRSDSMHRIDKAFFLKEFDS